MKSLWIFFILLLFGLDSLAQRLVVVDSLNNDFIPFAKIYIGDSGFYTDKNGNFDAEEFANEIIKVVSPGYKTKEVFYPGNWDTIFMIPEPVELETVIINHSNPEKIIINPKNKKEDFGSFPIKDEQEIRIHIIPSLKIADFKLEELVIPFEKGNVLRKNEQVDFKGKRFREFLKELKKQEVFVRINIYRIQDENIIYSSHPLGVNSTKRNELVVNLEKENIFIPEEGLIIGLEVIGFDKRKENLSYGVSIRPKMTFEVNEYFQSITFIKYNFPLPYYYELSNKFEGLKHNWDIGFRLIK